MRKRRVYLVVIGVVLAVVAVIWVFRPEREPEYGGKKLSEWVQLYNGLSAFPNPDAESAVQHVGSNALPYLLQWMHYEQANWKREFFKTTNSLIRYMTHSWRLREAKREARALGAIRALTILGPEAVPSITVLTRLLNNANYPFKVTVVAGVLADLGEIGLPPLLSVLTNAHAPAAGRKLVSAGIGERVRHNGNFVRALQHMLNNPDRSAREAATNLLLEFNPSALPEDNNVSPRASAPPGAHP